MTDRRLTAESRVAFLSSSSEKRTPDRKLYFQNDITYKMDSEISMYADDHKIYQEDKEISAVTTKLKESAKRATDWYDNNLLERNLDKCQIMCTLQTKALLWTIK